MVTPSPLDAKTAAALSQAIAMARQGNPAGARAIAQAALATGGDGVALNAFLGMIEAKSGDLPAAIPHLTSAHALRPDDVTIALNLISALVDNGDHARAFGIATPALAARDPSFRIARYRAFCAQVTENYPEAVAYYRQVVASLPDDFESWNNLGNACSATGDVSGAVSALKTAMALDPKSLPTRLNLAVALREADCAQEAEQTLRKAAEDFPEDGRPWHEIYVNAKRDWDHEKALEALQNTVARDKSNAGLQFKLAVEKGILHRHEESEAAFECALQLDPQLTDAYLGLAIQYEHTNREQMFAPLIARSEANDLAPGAVSFLRALEWRREGKFDAALAAIDSVPPEIEPQRTVHTRATILERLGRSEEAFAAFSEANRMQTRNVSDPLGRAADLRDRLEREICTMTPEWVDGWTSLEPAADHPSPVFLVGFPRSGTTLLDTMLMGHPDAVVLEEQPPLNHVDAMVGGIDALPHLDQATLDAARARYFDEVAKLSDWTPDKLLIDKSPMFLHKAALIHRLFPDARFILALRHPCDVVLSCFMSNFRLNSAMANFLRIEDAADFYDITFRHWEQANAILPLNVSRVVYEELIEDVEGVLRPLFDFLELPWNAKVLDHTKTARSRGLIKTASYSQVVEPIYNRASGRWLRYRSELAEVWPTLAPWAAKFGFAH
jgi:tetratricopeptide (TPR) repeat protein